MKDHVLSFLSAYQGTLAEVFSLPDALSENYILFDCLTETQEKSTYLLRSRSDDSFAVLKTAKNSAREHLHAEYEILNNLHSPVFPHVISYFSKHETDFLLRSHVAGMTVSDFIERNGPFSEAEAIRLVLGLCDALAILHAQHPPVIHRDIKPQNVIFTRQRTLALIDFDAARRFHHEQKNDTVCLGTQATAAPEQFGYQQTDHRADIYSTGVLLLYLCTGAYEPTERTRIHSRALRLIIETSTRFDPARRYASIRTLSRSLRHASASLPDARTFWRGAAVGLLAGVCISAALVFSGAIKLDSKQTLPQETAAQAAAPDVEEQPIRFESPEVEQAVRAQLGFEEDEPLMQADLDRVTGLYLFGTFTPSDWNDVSFYSIYRTGTQAGTIDTLRDIPKLRNLKELCLSNQQISDLSPLNGMQLVRLALGGNRITDLSPLASLTSLRELYLANNPITQIDALQKLPGLQVADLSETKIYDILALNNTMTDIYLSNTPIFDYRPLLEMPSLRLLFLTRPDADAQVVLSQLTQLTTLVVNFNITDLAPILPLTNLTSLAVDEGHLMSLEGIDSLQQLTYLRLIASPNIDLMPLTRLPNLLELDIFGQTLSDYSAIFKIPSLMKLYCSEEQRDEIEALALPHTFELIVV